MSRSMTFVPQCRIDGRRLDDQAFTAMLDPENQAPGY